jgi:hypothetical protein
MKEIILLDGTTHTQEELIDQMYVDSFYYDYLKASLRCLALCSRS